VSNNSSVLSGWSWLEHLVQDVAPLRLVYDFLMWVFGAAFIKPDDSYDTLLRKAILSALPVFFVFAGVTPYWFWSMYHTRPADASAHELPTRDEVTVLSVYAWSIVVWTALCIGIGVYSRNTGNFSPILLDVFFWATNVSILLAVTINLRGYSTLFSVATSIVAVAARTNTAPLILLANLVFLAIDAVNTAAASPIIVLPGYQGGPDAHLPYTVLERAFMHTMGLAAFTLTIVAVSIAGASSTREAEKLRGAAAMCKRFARMSKSYNVDGMRAVLDRYALEAGCDSELLATQRAVVDNLERYRPHIPAYLIETESSTDLSMGEDMGPARDEGDDRSPQEIDPDLADYLPYRGGDSATSNGGRSNQRHQQHRHHRRGLPQRRPKADDAFTLDGGTDTSTELTDASCGSPYSKPKLSSSMRSFVSDRSLIPGQIPAGVAASLGYPAGPRSLFQSSQTNQFCGVVSFVRICFHGIFQATANTSEGATTISEFGDVTPTAHGAGDAATGNVGSIAVASVGAFSATGEMIASGRARKVSRLVEFVVFEAMRNADAGNGSVLSAVGDEITVTWNATRRAARTGVKACTFANAMRNAAARHLSTLASVASGSGGGGGDKEKEGGGGGAGSSSSPSAPTRAAAETVPPVAADTTIAGSMSSATGSASASGQWPQQHSRHQHPNSHHNRTFEFPLLSAYATTAPAYCFFAGDKRQRLLTTLSLGQWHQRLQGLAKVAREMAEEAADRCIASRQLAPTAGAALSTGSGPTPNVLSPSTSTATSLYPTLHVAVDAATQGAAQFSHRFRPASSLPGNVVDAVASAASAAAKLVGVGGGRGPTIAAGPQDNSATMTAAADWRRRVVYELLPDVADLPLFPAYAADGAGCRAVADPPVGLALRDGVDNDGEWMYEVAALTVGQDGTSNDPVGLLLLAPPSVASIAVAATGTANQVEPHPMAVPATTTGATHVPEQNNNTQPGQEAPPAAAEEPTLKYLRTAYESAGYPVFDDQFVGGYGDGI
jgi:hypothetical protein